MEETSSASLIPSTKITPLEKNSCDFVLANDLQKIHNSNHAAMLIKSDQSFMRLNTKAEIAGAIVQNVILSLKKEVGRRY